MPPTIAFLPPPAALLQVTQLAAHAGHDTSEIADVIASDETTAAEVLHAVNSEYYGRRRQVATVGDAVAFLGRSATRNLLLCLCVRHAFSGIEGFPLQLFWERSLLRAAAVKAIARRLGIPKVEELFAIGLCQDIGVLARLLAEPELCADMAAVLGRPARERRERELKIGTAHDELGYLLFDEWRLPPELSVPIRYHHEPLQAPDPYRLRTQVAHAAEAIADLFGGDDKVLAFDRAEKSLDEVDVGRGQLERVFDDVSAEFVAAGQMLQLPVRAQPSYQDIAAYAGQGLISAGLSYQEMAEHLQRALAEQQRQAQELRHLNEMLQAQATTDVLTGLHNRRAFEDALERELARAQRLDRPLALLLADVDHFKRLNDTYGHLAGDRVLQQIGRKIVKSLRRVDFPTRYGGEEFAILLPHTPLDSALIAAERVRKEVEDLEVEWEGHMLTTTISIGCTTIEQPEAPGAGVAALQRADDALYEAKESGRNRIVTRKPDQ